MELRCRTFVDLVRLTFIFISPAGALGFLQDGVNLDSRSQLSSGYFARGSGLSKPSVSDKPPASFTLKVGRVSAQVKQLEIQGTRSFVYRVTGGWGGKPAIAKTASSGEKSLDVEMGFLKKVS